MFWEINVLNPNADTYFAILRDSWSSWMKVVSTASSTVGANDNLTVYLVDKTLPENIANTPPRLPLIDGSYLSTGNWPTNDDNGTCKKDLTLISKGPIDEASGSI